MKKLFFKELRLAASPLSFFFLVAGFLTLVPGYPILLGAFFITLGIFYSFQTTRENNDIGFSLLLPIAKKDVVKGKFVFVLFLELSGFLLMTGLTLLRMAVLSKASVYVSNALMGANFTFLGLSLLLFGLFNFLFVRGFFKTAYYFGKPFILYLVFSLLLVTVSEALHFFPGLSPFFSLGFSPFTPQFSVFLLGLAAFLLLTVFAVRRSEKSFETIDF